MTRTHIGSGIQGVGANQQRGADQAAVGADRLTREVEPYRDPATGRTYELSFLYGNAWVNGNDNDEVVLSGDPNFNPASVFNANWSPSSTRNPHHEASELGSKIRVSLHQLFYERPSHVGRHPGIAMD